MPSNKSKFVKLKRKLARSPSARPSSHKYLHRDEKRLLTLHAAAPRGNPASAEAKKIRSSIRNRKK